MKRKRKPQIGREFIRRTQFKFLEPSDQSRGLPPPPIQLPPEGSHPLVDLPAPGDIQIDPLDLRTAIEKRASVREYLEGALSLDALAFLLWATQGVKEVDGIDTFRTAPSAGARHPFETYLLLRRVDSLRPGLYRYLPLAHKLETLDTNPETLDRITRTHLQPELLQGSAVAFIWTAVVTRTTWRYGDRGYRYIFLDAGHIGQNLYLAALAVGCGACTTAAFHDDDLNHTLGIDGNTHIAVYTAAVGK